jgi:hypothetical protein
VCSGFFAGATQHFRAGIGRRDMYAVLRQHYRVFACAAADLQCMRSVRG